MTDSETPRGTLWGPNTDWRTHCYLWKCFTCREHAVHDRNPFKCHSEARKHAWKNREHNVTVMNITTLEIMHDYHYQVKYTGEEPMF